MIKRKIMKAHPWNQNPYFRRTYIVLKPTKENGWNPKGRGYSERGIATYVHQSRNSTLERERKEIEFEPSSLEKEVDLHIRKYILNNSSSDEAAD